MATRISSLDAAYQSGDLSIYPIALDDKTILYDARNNAEVKLKQSLTYTGKHIVVDDATMFPENGLIRLGPKSGEQGNAELIYYGKRTNSVFSDLIRGFAGSRQSTWSASTTFVAASVMAEHHNAIKDAIINIEKRLGTAIAPDKDSLNGILTDLEIKFLAPKPVFRSFPLRGPPILNVTFQNFSEGDIIRYFWDFGDGTTSLDKSPTHAYQTEGIYTVKLNIITSTGAQGIAVKSNYITVSNEEKVTFFYVVQEDPDSPAYSTQTALELDETPATFLFVDQTDGDIIQRFWVFGDGTTASVIDPDTHTTKHIYDKPGEYDPSLLVIFSDQQQSRIFLQEKVVVI
jgi:PKD repeat protein